jgi:hypothetical protein
MPINEISTGVGIPLPTVDFDWSPKSVPVSYTVGGNTYPYARQADGQVRTSDSRYTSFTTPTNTVLTFTASISLVGDNSIVQYLWNFGDGSSAFGSSVSYMYKIANPSAEVSLAVTDIYGRTVARHRVLNLRTTTAVSISAFRI